MTLIVQVILAVLCLVILWQQRKLFHNQKQLLENDIEIFRRLNSKQDEVGG